jgi:O-antigen ligase
MHKHLPSSFLPAWLLLALAALATWAGIALGIRLEMPLLYLLGPALVLAWLASQDYRILFWLLMAAIPVSTELKLGGSFSLDAPSEPLMLALLALFLLQLLAGRLYGPATRIYPFHVLVLLLLAWALVCSITSRFPERSLKFWAAKAWYLAAFVALAQQVIRRPEEVVRVFWWVFWPMLGAVAFISAKHAAEGFSFESAHAIPQPLFVNGVIYGATLALFLPWCWFMSQHYPARSWQRLLIFAGMALMLAGVLFAYKRGAWLAVLLSPPAFWLIRQQWMSRLLLGGLLVLTLALAWLLSGNRFYQFAPNYQSTIWHEGDLEAHLTATFEGNEISSVERFYRWVAAKNMIAAMPFFGSGPSTFNQVYKEYADDAFRTYVSDNPEQSTTHNYFLMTFTEQGFPGGLLFFGLCVYMLVKGARLYPLIRDPLRKKVLALALLSLITILLHSVLNELIETDKVGSFFWLNLTLIHLSQVWHEADEQQGSRA